MALMLLAPFPGAQQQARARIGYSFPSTGQARTGLANAAESLVSDSYFTVGADGRLVPKLAESWAPTRDFPGWQFKLHTEIRFHNKQAAHARAIGSLLERILGDPEELVFHPGFKEITGLAARDDHTLELRTVNRRLSMLDELAEVPLRARVEGGELGPFHIARYGENEFEARAFSEYYRGRPLVDVVEFKGYASHRAAWAALMRDEIDAVYEVGREVAEFVELDSRMRVHSFLRPYPATVFFNVRAPQLRDRRVRIALNRAVDREAIVRAAYRGRGRAADGVLWPDHWAAKAVRSPVPFDRAAAAALLSQAGFRPKPARLEFRCLVLAGLETQPFERVALMLQKQLFDAGVEMKLEAVPLREFLSRIATGNFDAALFEFAARTPASLYRFWRSPREGSEVWVRHGYSAADRELDAMYGAETDEELRTAIAGVYRRMAEDPPAIFIAWPEVARAASRRFEIPVEPGTDIMGANMRLWRPARPGGTD